MVQQLLERTAEKRFDDLHELVRRNFRRDDWGQLKRNHCLIIQANYYAVATYEVEEVEKLRWKRLPYNKYLHEKTVKVRKHRSTNPRNVIALQQLQQKSSPLTNFGMGSRQVPQKIPFFESHSCKELMTTNFDKVCTVILRNKGSRSTYVQQTLLIVFPRLAAFNHTAFSKLYLEETINFLLLTLKNSKERTAAFQALGLLSISVEEDVSKHLGKIMEVLKNSLPSKDLPAKKHKSFVVDPAVFTCISMLARAVGPRMTKDVRDMLDSMLATGLSPALTAALKDLATQIPQLKKEIQDGLLKSLSLILIGRPLKHPGAPNSPTLPIPVSGSVGNLAETQDVTSITLALKTLGSFDFEGTLKRKPETLQMWRKDIQWAVHDAEPPPEDLFSVTDTLDVEGPSPVEDAEPPPEDLFSDTDTLEVKRAIACSRRGTSTEDLFRVTDTLDVEGPSPVQDEEPPPEDLFSVIDTLVAEVPSPVHDAEPPPEDLFSVTDTLEVKRPSPVHDAEPPPEDLFSVTDTFDVEGPSPVEDAEPPPEDLFSDTDTLDVEGPSPVHDAEPRPEDLFSVTDTLDVEGPSPVQDAEPPPKDLFSVTDTLDVEGPSPVEDAEPPPEDLFSVIDTLDVEGPSPVQDEEPPPEDLFSVIDTLDVEGPSPVKDSEPPPKDLFSVIDTLDIKRPSPVQDAEPPPEDLFRVTDTLDVEGPSDNEDDVEDSDYVPDSDMDTSELSEDNMDMGAVSDGNMNFEDGELGKDLIQDNDMDAIDNELEGNDDDMISEGVEDEPGKCSHEFLNEEFIIRDKVHPGIYVRKTLKSFTSQTGRKKATDRVYNNYHCCFVCKKLSTNILKHLRCHKDHDDCIELLRLKKEIEKGNSKAEEIIAKKDQLKAKQTLLRNKGDDLHNMTVIKMKEGELIIARKQGKFSSDEYGPCPLCSEWIKKESLSFKHQKTCPGSIKTKKMTKGEAILRSEFAMGKINEKASKGLVKEVYPIMTRDCLTNSAKADPLIVALGNTWLRRNLGNKIKRKYYTSSRMRGSARLLHHLQDLSAEKLTLSDYLKPKYFDLVCEGALLCAHMENDDEEDLKSPSAALKIGFDIGRMANIKLGLALRSSNKEEKQEAEEFSSLIKLEWSTRVSKLAHLKLQDMKVNKPASPLPIPEDLSVLGGRVVNEMKTMKYEKDIDTYRRAVMLVQTRLLTYNKRRSGELEALSLQNYRGRSIGLDEADSALLGNDMSELEMHLVESQELIKIRGKNGKTVPVLVPDDTKEALSFIAEDNVRRAVGIKTWNPYLFANTGDSVMRAYDSLKTICAEHSLKAPERITSVSMRKYIATLSQVIDMKDHELEWLCTHLGHTASIHKLHYRATSGFIERVNIGKLMLLQDLNLAGKYAGQRLQDIDITDVINARPDIALQQQDQEGSKFMKGDDDDDDDDDVGKETVAKKKEHIQRQRWTTEEERELEELFKENFKLKKNPGLKDCTSAIAKSRKKKGLVQKRSWETIKKKVLRMMKKTDD
ncbi:uncharacterized protein [Argopecten irradians]|uniref:uncharacterized protein n=1 Tax=Argopecten irradians TaxID=31199 RepID=UPI003713BC44